MPRSFHNQTVPGQEEHNSLLLFLWMGLIAASAVFWVLLRCFGLRTPQIVELFIVAAVLIAFLINTVKSYFHQKTLLAEQWPRPRLRISEAEDRRQLEQAARDNTTLLGYENDGTPLFWSDEQRALQTNLPGMSGSGKSTLLLNILDQDIRRGHPVIVFDGKGSKDFVFRLLAFASAAGRGADVRIIDPSHPEVSDKYNPFYSPAGKRQQRAGAVFDSLGASQAKDEFFAEHQRAFLDSVTNILSYTGRTLTFKTILKVSQRPDVMMELIKTLRETVRTDPAIGPNEIDAFEMDAFILEGIYGDPDWLGKIRGLLNSMKPFVGDSLVDITCATEDLVTLADVIEKKQILIVSMNVGGDSQAARSLGRILMRDLQAIISARYDDYVQNKKHSFISVVLDEFGLYAYGGFSNIIHTAREANAGFIFSFQNIMQLESAVGPSFANDVANATNSKFLMRISEKDTAENFMHASAAVPTTKLSTQVAKLNPLEGREYEEQGTATRTETSETRVQDRHVKILPTGQMMALFADARMGLVVKHVHVRRPFEYFFPLPPAWTANYSKPASTSRQLDIDSLVSAPVEEPTKRGQRRARRS